MLGLILLFQATINYFCSTSDSEITSEHIPVKQLKFLQRYYADNIVDDLVSNAANIFNVILDELDSRLTPEFGHLFKILQLNCSTDDFIQYKDYVIIFDEVQVHIYFIYIATVNVYINICSFH